jgi:hypothetical protein
MASASISSVNYNGKIGNITFYPYTGGTTVNIGPQTIPYTYNTNYPYGRYDIYFSTFNKTCSNIMSPPNQVLPCDILTLYIYTDLYEFESSLIRRYDFPGNTSTPLTGSYGRYSYDIAHTANKFWFNSNRFVEYNITSNPWTANLNRQIFQPSGYNLIGLSAINDTLLLSVNTAVSPNTIVRLDITTTTAVPTIIGSLPADRLIIGDITLTSTNKMLVTNRVISSPTTIYLTQYNYLTGAFEGEINIGTQIPSPEGIFVQNNEIYIMNSGGQVYNIMKTSPYTITYIKTDPELQVAGVSQRLECVNQHITFGSWYCLEQCPSVSWALSQSDTPVINDLPPLQFDFCFGEPGPKMYLPSGLPIGTVVKGTDGNCYSTIDNTGYAEFTVGTIINRQGTSTYASCNICNNRTFDVYVSVQPTICDMLGSPGVTYLTYRINGGPWITGTTPIYPYQGATYVSKLNLTVSSGSVIDLYFSGIKWGIGYNTGDYTSRCSSQVIYSYTIPTVTVAEVYLNLNTTTSFNGGDFVCRFVTCPSYPRPRPYVFREQTYTKSLYELNYYYSELNYNIPFENIYTLAIETTVWSESTQNFNSKPSYQIPSSDYLSTISYVWYDNTTNLWTESSALGGGLIYATLDSLSTSEPVNGPVNPWISTAYVTSSYIINSEPNSEINTNGLVLWYDAGSTLTWPGSGTALYDITGNNQGTSYTGGTINPPYFTKERMGSIQFSTANNTAILCGNGPTLSGITNVVTVEAWIKPTSFNNGNVFSKNSNQAFRCRIDSIGRIWMLGAKAGPSFDTYTSTGTLTIATWSHIVVIWTSTGYYTYINGVSAGSDLTKTFLVQQNNYDLLLGQNAGQAEKFDGLGSIFRVYNRVLSASEVLANFNSEKSRFGF